MSNKLWHLHIEGTSTIDELLEILHDIELCMITVTDDEEMNNWEYQNVKAQLSLDREYKNPDGSLVNVPFPQKNFHKKLPDL